MAVCLFASLLLVPPVKAWSKSVLPNWQGQESCLIHSLAGLYKVCGATSSGLGLWWLWSGDSNLESDYLSIFSHSLALCCLVGSSSLNPNHRNHSLVFFLYSFRLPFFPISFVFQIVWLLGKEEDSERVARTPAVSDFFHAFGPFQVFPDHYSSKQTEAIAMAMRPWPNGE